MVRWAAPAAIVLSMAAIYSGPDLGGLALAALVCWGLALAFDS